MYTTNIKLKYLSYYKVNKEKKNFYYFFYILHKYNKLILTYVNIPLKKKYFTLVKSPKCFKVGKFLINYKLHKFIFNFKLQGGIVPYPKLLNYFNYLLKKYNIYQTIFQKNNSMTVKLNINYNLKILNDFFVVVYIFTV